MMRSLTRPASIHALLGSLWVLASGCRIAAVLLEVRHTALDDIHGHRTCLYENAGNYIWSIGASHRYYMLQMLEKVR